MPALTVIWLMASLACLIGLIIFAYRAGKRKGKEDVEKDYIERFINAETEYQKRIAKLAQQLYNIPNSGHAYFPTDDSVPEFEAEIKPDSKT